MYTDTILFLIGAAGFIILAVSIIYLVGSSKRSKTFKKFILEETEYSTLRNSTFANTGKTDISTVTDYSKTILDDIIESCTVISHTENIFDSRENDDTDIMTLLDKNATDIIDYSKKEHSEKDDMQLLNRLYIIEKIIYSGPMSKVFIAHSVKLNNKCIIKFVTHAIGDVTYEHDKLKDLYHTSLPKIIDVFTDDKGVYLVESYIEGENLSDIMKEVFKSKKVFNQYLIMDWAKQLCNVYSYLHNLPDSPIYHFDIKPANIMVTHGYSLVPIDFGISKRAYSDSKAIVGVSPLYAAPEQFKNHLKIKYKKIIEFRFGNLSDDFSNRIPDARTDIYSLGTVLFELSTGVIPTVNNISSIKNVISHSFAKIILKCIEINPDDRYQSINEMVTDLQKLNAENFKIHRSMVMRRITAVTAVLSFMLMGSGFAGGGYIYQQEALSVVGVEPQYLTISLQQSSELKIEKEMPDGNIIMLNPGDLTWSSGSSNIAKIDGNRIAGINVGETEIEGKYRNHLINIIVNVVEPMDGTVDIVQQYEHGHKVILFGGTAGTDGWREHTDGLLAGEAEFVSPESICITDDGTIYIVDSGVLRRITDNLVESIDIEPFYMTPHIVRCHENDIYILTNEWEETDGSYSYGIVKLLNDGTVEEIYITDAVYTAVEDFGFSPENDDILYFIERNAGMDAVYFKTIDLRNTEDIKTLLTLKSGTVSFTFDKNGTAYFANSETGVIQYYKNGELKYFAGVENEKAFIDGKSPLFYMPQKIKYSENALYVWDFNVLRKITIENKTMIDCITLAGEVSPEFDLEHIEKEYNAENVILANSHLVDFVMNRGNIILTDPKRGVIWEIK